VALIRLSNADAPRSERIDRTIRDEEDARWL
jgi:hypothetical protein